MQVYAVVGTNWNLEYGYDEYSLPISIHLDKDVADGVAFERKCRIDQDDSTYEDYIVAPYELK